MESSGTASSNSTNRFSSSASSPRISRSSLQPVNRKGRSVPRMMFSSGISARHLGAQAQRSIEIISSTYEPHMAEALREISQMLAHLRQLLGVESLVTCAIQHRIEDQPGYSSQLARASASLPSLHC